MKGAVTVARDARPAAICLPGAEEGDHEVEKGADIALFVPEALDALEGEG